MPTHFKHTEKERIYFVTFTCYKWLSLFEISNSYNSVYKWFSYLNKQECKIVGFVIMPNHVHALIYLPKNSKELNTLVGNGKRFIAYDIIKRLEAKRDYKTLSDLKLGVTKTNKKKGQKHQVFKLSFDAKICDTEKMIEEILEYIHHNPVKGKWNLVNDFTDYPHSSAKFYELNESYGFSLTHYKDL